MLDTQKFIKDSLIGLSGKVIALIYSFENEDAPGFSHYEFWRSEVITAWLSAVQEIGCKPYILDVRTFMIKASMGTLPHIDYCVNLNAGNNNVDNLCLVPAICSFCGIPIIPCSAKTCAVGEDKLFANLIAKNGEIKIPEYFPYNKDGGIIRDRSLGSSVGIRLTSTDAKCSNTEICQKFIVGADMTIPVLFNPLIQQMEVLPSVIYKHSYGNKWFLDEKTKLNHAYEKMVIELSEQVQNAVLSLIKKFDIMTFCRIDTRVENYKFDKEICLKDIYFIEINPTPTIHNTINFALSILEASNKTQHKQCFDLYKAIVKNASVTGYILFCSLSTFKATH